MSFKHVGLVGEMKIMEQVELSDVKICNFFISYSHQKVQGMQFIHEMNRESRRIAGEEREEVVESVGQRPVVSARTIASVY